MKQTAVLTFKMTHVHVTGLNAQVSCQTQSFVDGSYYTYHVRR